MLQVRLLKREREINELRQSLSRTELWTRVSLNFAAAIGICDSAALAVDTLARGLVDELAVDYARIVWRDIDFEYPTLESEEARACVANLFRSGMCGGAPDETRDPLFGFPLHMAIPSHVRDSDDVSVYTAVRIGQLDHLDPELEERLHDLVALLEHPFDALRLRLVLTEERDQLQAWVDEATSDLRYALQHAEEARSVAERAAKVRAEFLAHMSHEIRTPLTAVLAYAEMLANPAGGLERDKERASRYVTIIIRSGRHLLQLLNDILDLARIESGRFRLEPVEGSVPQLLMDVASLLRVPATAGDLALSVTFETPLPESARLDIPRLRQILLNVVGNAIKFTERGEVKICASVSTVDDEAQSDEPARMLMVRVQDSGVGIPSEALSEIFDEFETSRRRENKAQKGTGLGLAISRRLARMMGGDMTATSEVGVGSIFTVRIPLELVEGTVWVDAPRPISDVVIPNDAEASRRFDGRVLLAEDTEIIATVIQDWLEMLGLDVTVVPNGLAAAEAVERDSQRPFDLVFMDMQMPKLDGYEATRRLRRGGKELPIIALTAHALKGERERCIEAGCSDYLTKPVDRVQLIGVLERHLSSYDARKGRISTNEPAHVLTDLLDEFFRDLAVNRERMATALDAGDIDTIQRISHKIAGIAGTFGFPALTTRARELEQMARGSDDVQRQYARAMHEIDMVLKAAAGDSPSPDR